MEEAEHESRGSRRAGRLLLALGSTLAALLLGEVALRVMNVEPDRFVHMRTLETEDKRLLLDLYPDDPADAFPVDLRDAEVRAGYRARGLPEVDEHYERTPFGVEIAFDASLCRARSVEAPSTSRRRVMFIGDSFTEGQGVLEEDTAVRRVATALGDEVEVINCARRGYDFPRLREWFEARLEREPDVVVYAMVLNDPEQSEEFHARQAYVDDWIVDRRRMIESGDGSLPFTSSRLLAVVSDRVEGFEVGRATTAWYREMVGPENAEGWQRTRAHLAAMHQTMRARGGRFLVVLWPLMVDFDDYPFRETHRTIVGALRDDGVDVHDTLPAFEGEDASSLIVHPTDRHPNARAQAIFADAILAHVERAVDAR